MNKFILLICIVLSSALQSKNDSLSEETMQKLAKHANIAYIPNQYLTTKESDELSKCIQLYHEAKKIYNLRFPEKHFLEASFCAAAILAGVIEKDINAFGLYLSLALYFSGICMMCAHLEETDTCCEAAGAAYRMKQSANSVGTFVPFCLPKKENIKDFLKTKINNYSLSPVDIENIAVNIANQKIRLDRLAIVIKETTMHLNDQNEEHTKLAHDLYQHYIERLSHTHFCTTQPK